MQQAQAGGQSPSEILRCDTILLFRLDKVAFAEWAGEPGSELLKRDVAMTVTIEEVLKGAVQQQQHKPFSMTVVQRGTGSFRVMDYYGLWSHVDPAPGSRFLAFCAGASSDAAALLSGDACEQLADPAHALQDTKAALELEGKGATPDRILAEACARAGERRDYFARYVWARVETEALRRLETFDKVLGMVSDPKTTTQARSAYLTLMYETLGMLDPPRCEFDIRLVRAMFHLLAMPQAQDLHATIATTYLPNLLDLGGPAPAYSASQVFEGRPEARREAQAAVQVVAGAPARLSAWLKAR